jgi:hypothetical protein
MKEFLRWLRILALRWPNSKLDEKLRFHVQQSTARNIASGMKREEARHPALIEFGGVERTRELCQEQRPGWWIGTVAHRRCTTFCADSATTPSSRLR